MEPDGFVKITCCTCSVVFYITKVLLKLREKDSRTFFCPIGHTLAYPKPNVDVPEKKQSEKKVTKSIKKENTILKIRVSHLEDQLEAAKSERKTNGY